MPGDVALQQRLALLVFEVDDLNAMIAQPIDAADKGAALTDNDSAESELPNEAATVPAGRERSDHDQIAITALAPGAAECIGFPVDTGIALLNAAIVAAADK